MNAFARLAVLAVDILRNTPDPDMALNNLERYIRIVASAESRFNTLLSQPMRLEILLGIFSASQFLADTVIRHPGFIGLGHRAGEPLRDPEDAMRWRRNFALFL